MMGPTVSIGTSRNAASIRQTFIRMVENAKMLKHDYEMVEMLNCTFEADEPAIFGTPNEDWHARELEWYLSQSLNVEDIPEPIPTIWKEVAADDGTINSNYGWCIFSGANGDQYENCIRELVARKYSRQGTMIYTRPSMQWEATDQGRYDFICTNTVQLAIRPTRIPGQWDGTYDYLHYIVNMRSSDAVLGYKGDYAWHSYVHKKALDELRGEYPELMMGKLIWNANSFHVYPRHYDLVSRTADEMWEQDLSRDHFT